MVALFLMSIYYTFKDDESQLKIFLTNTAVKWPQVKKEKKKKRAVTTLVSKRCTLRKSCHRPILKGHNGTLHQYEPVLL